MMMAGQVAVCLALLIGAGLLTSASIRMLTLDPGFDTHRVLAVSIASLQELGYSPARAHEFDRRLEERIRALPGVASFSTASRVPLGGNVTATRVGDSAERYPYAYVSRAYFETLGVPLLRGRSFTNQEIATNAPVTVISESLARRLWPSGDAIGQHIALGSRTEGHIFGQRGPVSAATEIIGVAGDVYSVDFRGPDSGALYLPQPAGAGLGDSLVRVTGDPAAVAALIVHEVRAAEPGLPVSAQTLHDYIARGESTVYRISAMIFGAIGIIGFGLASVGVYSMVAYTVSRQSREVGIRIALGAQRRDVVRTVLAPCVRWIASGLAIGAAAGLALSRLLASQLALGGSRLNDPAVIALISAGTGLLALVAAYVPARRATRLDPSITLRFE
jgi:putative ABC transport system permease protein